MSLNLEHKVWPDKYRPRNLKECFLPKETRKVLKSFLRKDMIPNMLFSGTPGIGKTATARAFLEEAGVEYIVINGSLNGNIDTLRNEIQQFASTVSFNGKKKYVIIDEADYLSQATQAALRGFIEEYSANCGYIFTCNYRNKIIAAIQESRLMSEVQFIFNGDERAELAQVVCERLLEILKKEGVEYEINTVRAFIVNHLKKSNDIRKLFVNAQRNALSGVFQEIHSVDGFSARFDGLTFSLKARDFGAVRTWIGENSDIDTSTIFRYIYDNAKTVVQPVMVPAVVLIIAKYQFQHAFVADTEINLMACMTEIMTEAMS